MFFPPLILKVQRKAEKKILLNYFEVSFLYNLYHKFLTKELPFKIIQPHSKCVAFPVKFAFSQNNIALS